MSSSNRIRQVFVRAGNLDEEDALFHMHVLDFDIQSKCSEFYSQLRVAGVDGVVIDHLDKTLLQVPVEGCSIKLLERIAKRMKIELRWV